MNDEERYPPTVKIRRPSKVTTDERGRTVWVGEVEETELELMSTGELKKALATAEGSERDSIESIARSGKQGVIVRDRATGVYSVLSDAEIQRLMKDSDVSSSGIDTLKEALVPAQANTVPELSLVSTQALRVLLEKETHETDIDASADDSGFDPYDRS